MSTRTPETFVPVKLTFVVFALIRFLRLSVNAVVPAFEIATLATRKITSEDLDNPNRIKIVIDKNNSALYFSRSAIPNQINYKGDGLSSYPFLRHIGLYAYRRKTLFLLSNLPVSLLESIESLEQLRWLYNGFSIYVSETTLETPNIDTIEDVEIVLRSL